jgi:hypothetical protein
MREYAGRTHQAAVGPRTRASDFQPATVDPAALPVRVEKLAAAGSGISCRVLGIVWGGPTPARALGIRFNPGLRLTPVEDVGHADGRTWALWSHRFELPAPGRYRIELGVTAPAVRTRRLDTGFYAREIEIT